MGSTSDTSLLFTAELVAPSGRLPGPFGEPIDSGSLRQEIILSDMLRVAMNKHTTATIDVVTTTAGADAENNATTKAGYEIYLAKGELYVEVVPGHSFRVTTPNALLTITGTQFNVKADHEQTDLTFLKGSVRLGSLTDIAPAPGRALNWVNITAGHASSITGHALPLSPTLLMHLPPSPGPERSRSKMR